MKAGFYTALLLGVIGLVDMVRGPVGGFVEAALFFAAAWGIRRGRPWAAMAALTMVGAPLVAIVLQGIGRANAAGLAIPILLLTLAASLFAYSAIILFRRRGAGFMAGKDWIMAVLILLVFTACFSFRPYNMPTASMANTLHSGDFILVDVASPALGWNPKHDVLVTFRPPYDAGQTFVKRVAGVPGDRIRIQNKRLLRNGVPVEEPWAIHLTDYTDTYRDNFPDGTPPDMLHAPAKTMLAQVRSGEVVVPEGMLFVLGDNRDNSLDSRYFGLVPRADVSGRPLVVYGSSAPEARFKWTFKRL